MPINDLIFRQIDLRQHAELCVRFRADSYVCGDGSADRFYATAGVDGRDYLERLAKYSLDLPGSCVHAWLDNQIVGQIEMMRDMNDPTAGKVNLFYLQKNHRGQGLGQQLEQYAVDYFQRVGFSKAWLRVSATNARAIAFYKKHGWIDGGRDAKNPNMCLMRKSLQ